MNIGHRINARKIMLAYLYTDYFYRNFEVKAVDKEVFHDALVDDDFLNGLDIGLYENDSNSCPIGSYGLGKEKKDLMIISSGLHIETDDVDWDYVTNIKDHYMLYETEVANLVTKYLSQFQWEELEPLKKALFVLGYTESCELKTDEKVVINEMIELAKRFGGNDVYKLVNGVFHKLLIKE